MLYAFFWAVPRRLNFICRRFGTLFYLHRRVGVKYDWIEKFGVFIQENVWLENSFEAIFRPNLFLY